MSENSIIEIKTEMSAMRTEMKFMNQNFAKLEKVMEQVVVIIQEQNNNKEKIKNLENDSLDYKERIRFVENEILDHKKRLLILEKDNPDFKKRIRILEDWKLKIVSIAGVVGLFAGGIGAKILELIGK